MKWIFSTLVFLFLSYKIFCQTIFDIEVDQLYLDERKLVFINKGAIESYNCDIESIKQKDFIYQFALECDNYVKLSKDTVRLDFDNILKFKTPSDFTKWLKDKKFVGPDPIRDSIHKVFFQRQSPHIFSELHYNYDEDEQKWIFWGADFWDYVYFRINKEYLILGLIEGNYDEDEINDFVIPTKDGGILVANYKYYSAENGRIDSINLNKCINTEDYFRIAKEGGRYKVYDKLFNEDILKSNFLKVKFGNNFNIVTNDKGVTVYDKIFDKVIQKNIQAAHDSLRIAQIIKDNKIKWIDESGNVKDTFPPPQWIVCGNTFETRRRIEKLGNDFVELTENSEFSLETKKDSIKIPITSNTQNIKYLNGNSKHDYESYSNLSAVFSFPYDYYCLNTTTNQKIAQITNKTDSLKSRLFWQRDYSGDKNVNKDSITQIINSLKDDIRIEPIFEGNLELKGYYHPIKFKENELYGYFPQNKSAKYKKIEDFNFFFAAFELPSGKKGWLDIYGNEYFEK